MLQKSLLSALLVVLLGRFGDLTDVPACGPLEVFLECSSICNDCIKRDNCSPPFVCQPGCNCKKGYFRDSTGNCIPECECPGGPICGVNEVQSQCVSPCNDCVTRGNCQFLVCNPGCDCLPGYHRDSAGICIPATDCPALPPTCRPPQCPPNEQPSDCVVPCNDCETRGKCEFLVCNKGCDCIPGYYRDASGTCIPQNQCPNTCPPFEELVRCVSRCDNCVDRYNCSPLFVCQPGCNCINGYYRDINTGVCVPEDQCTCPTNQGLTKCINECNTCEQQNVPCPRYPCRKGCDCLAGYTRNNYGNCIPIEQCDCQCPDNEEYRECVNPCRTCELKDALCKIKCYPGCDCIEGYVRDVSEGTCIPVGDCPASTEA